MVPERETERERETSQKNERKRDIYRGPPTAANYTENKHIAESNTLLLTGISVAGDGKITTFTGQPSVWQESEHV